MLTNITKTLNYALNISSGTFIARQDADDISLPNRFEKQLKWFSTSDKKVLCGTNCKIVSDDGKIRLNTAIRYRNSEIRKKLTYSNCFVHSSTMFLKCGIWFEIQFPDSPSFENSYNKQMINEGLAKEYWGGKKQWRNI